MARSRKLLFKLCDLGHFGKQVYASILAFLRFASAAQIPRAERKMVCAGVGHHVRLNRSETRGFRIGIIKSNKMLSPNCTAKSGLAHR